MNNRYDLSGILGFPVTPFNKNGEINENAFSKNVEFLIEGGVKAIFISAGAGEYQSLTSIEYEKLLEIAVDTTKDRVPVFTGVGGNIKTSIKFAELSEEKGAAGYLILPPYLINGEQQGLYNYYKEIIESTSLSTIIYQRDNAILSVETLQDLVNNHQQIIGFKDGFGNMELNVELTQSIGSKVQWINGMPFAEITMPTYLNLGFNSYSSAISNYIPHISKLFYQALSEKNEDLVSELYQNVLLPINKIRKKRKGYAVSLIKAGMEIIGLPVGSSVRAPLVPVEKEHYQEMERILNVAQNKYPGITVNN